jgi:hypothetical protein
VSWNTAGSLADRPPSGKAPKTCSWRELIRALIASAGRLGVGKHALNFLRGDCVCAIEKTRVACVRRSDCCTDRVPCPRLRGHGEGHDAVESPTIPPKDRTDAVAEDMATQAWTMPPATIQAPRQSSDREGATPVAGVFS